LTIKKCPDSVNFYSWCFLSFFFTRCLPRGVFGIWWNYIQFSFVLLLDQFSFILFSWRAWRLDNKV